MFLPWSYMSFTIYWITRYVDCMQLLSPARSIYSSFLGIHFSIPYVSCNLMKTFQWVVSINKGMSWPFSGSSSCTWCTSSSVRRRPYTPACVHREWTLWLSQPAHTLYKGVAFLTFGFLPQWLLDQHLLTIYNKIDVHTFTGSPLCFLYVGPSYLQTLINNSCKVC